MRLLSIPLLGAILLLSNSVQAQAEVFAQSETAKRYERTPGYAWNESTPAHQYRVARARELSAHRDAVLRAYEAAGIDYAHPIVNGMSYYPVPYRRSQYKPVYIYVPTYIPVPTPVDPVY